MNNWKAKLKSIVGFNSSSNSQNNNEGRIPQAPAPSNNGQIPLRMPQNRTNHFPPQISETREQIQDRQKQIKNGQNQAWLDSERLWQVRVGPGWVAQKVLGQGSEGIVGWWQYREIGGDENFLGLKNVAVKQNVMRYHVSNGRGLNQEAWFYRFLGRAQSQHIPKMYRELYQDVGRNTQDADRGPVERIFLEFCPGGDLQNLIDRRMDKFVQSMLGRFGRVADMFNSERNPFRRRRAGRYFTVWLEAHTYFAINLLMKTTCKSTWMAKRSAI